MVEFDDVSHLRGAAEVVRDRGFTQWDCFSPIPIHGMDGAMGIRPTIIPWLAFAGGLVGAAAGMAMQIWMNAIDYPYLISGKPLLSIPAFIPITFETTIVLAALVIVASLIAFNGFPQLYHPVFNCKRFERATTDRFFLLIEAKDPLFDEKETRTLLESMKGLSVERVEE